MKGLSLTLANRGRSLELAVAASTRDIMELVKVPNGQKYIAGGKTVPVKSPVDFMGVVRRTGQAICFDAKACSLVRSFHISNTHNVSPHQIEFLVRHGSAGAIAGLLVESKATERFLWLGWSHIAKANEAIRWIDSRWVDLGPTTHAIQLANIPGVSLPHCTGCTDPHSEGTHQCQTQEHP